MNNQSILLLAAILGLGIFGIVPQDEAAIVSFEDGQIYNIDYKETPADGWLGINSSHLHSFSGGWALEGALNGEDFWLISVYQFEFLPHWFILDLGESTAIKKVRGRSRTSWDPVSVDIYVSDDLESWGMAVATDITTWQDTSKWVEIDTIGKIGRYIKVEVNAIEGDGGDHYMEWGLNDDSDEPDYITIFDAYTGAGEVTPDPVPDPVGPVNIDLLNVQIEGKWLTWYMWLPQGYDVVDIIPDSILLNGVMKAAWRWINEPEQVLMAQFRLSEVQNIVEPGEVELTVSGKFTNGTKFEGSYTIIVKDKVGKE
ncbi:MAG: discoidin domain-containing protein [Planctomycetota bacterium]